MIIQRNAKKDTIRSLVDSELFFHADLLNDPHARGYLGSYLVQHLAKQRSIGSRSQEYVDYREAFDRIPDHFTDSLAKFARYISLEMMASFEESYLEMASRYEQFKETYQDARLNKVLEDRFLLDVATYRNVTDDVRLVDQKHELASLSDLMQQYQGQVVYLDLWASWCAPCREGLPHSRELARDYRDKPLKIIYLSVDKQADAWRKSSLVEQINQLRDSYLVLNADESDFFKQLKIKEIPRYLLYDKTGQLVHQHAPGPKGQDIRDLLDKYLAE